MKKTFVRLVTLGAGLILTSAALQAADAPVTGTFKGNGKDAKLAFAMAKKGDPFSGKETLVVVLTEKDTAGNPKPDFDAGFGKYGNSLTLTFFKDGGDIVGCEVNHDGNKNKPFSSIGKMKAENFKIEGSDVSAHLTTGGPVTAFEDTWQVDLNFKTKIQ
jgi:hypothetical protein